MDKLNIWIKAMRLRTLPLSLSGIIMGTAVANLFGYKDALIFVLAILTTISFQVLSNFANDLGDTLKGTDNDNRIGPKRTVQAGLISITQMKLALMITSFISLILSIFLIVIASKGMEFFLLVTFFLFAILSILSAIGYTLGKKAYGYYGLGDIMVFIFFGIVSVFGTYALYAKSIYLGCFFPSLTIGLLSVSVLNLNNLRDHQNDSISGKKTLVVRMGFLRAKKYHLLLIILAFISHLAFIFTIPSININRDFDKYFIMFSLIPFLFLFIHLYRVYMCDNTSKMDSELKSVALSTFCCSILTLIGTIFMN